MRFSIAMFAAAALATTAPGVAPHSALSKSVAPRPAAAVPAAPRPELPEPAAAAPAASAQSAHEAVHSSHAEGQDHADYLAWLAGSPAARAQVLDFTHFLESEGVGGVLPTWQLLRTASMWRECDGPRFEVAPADEWQHIAEALRFIRHHVEPAIGPVEAVSGYRNEELNRCARGAPASAHRHFYALDLVPVRDIGRAGLVRSLCQAHQGQGRAYDTGLGFYSGTRFHIDSKGFRRWGPDGSGATSPCVTEV